MESCFLPPDESANSYDNTNAPLAAWYWVVHGGWWELWDWSKKVKLWALNMKQRAWWFPVGSWWREHITVISSIVDMKVLMQLYRRFDCFVSLLIQNYNVLQELFGDLFDSWTPYQQMPPTQSNYVDPSSSWKCAGSESKCLGATGVSTTAKKEQKETITWSLAMNNEVKKNNQCVIVAL